jgi:hypothetical protein
MLPKTLIKGFDKGRLKGLLAVFFLALAVPTGALIWQAYSQLKWEAFHQHRGLAESLTGRVDAQLTDMINAADARSFADYTFLNVTGETKYNFVQRSPLSAYPVTEDLPGVMGYFQVDSDGSFSTPLLPPEGADAEQLGIGDVEYRDRLQLAQEIQSVLADNRLVQARAELGLRRDLSVAPAQPEEEREAGEKEADESIELFARSRQPEPGPETEAPASQPAATSAQIAEGVADGFLDEASADKDAVDEFEAKQQAAAASENAAYSQQVFDRLTQLQADNRDVSGLIGVAQFSGGTGEIQAEDERQNTIGKVSDLKLDEDLQKKSESLERAQEQQRQEISRDYAPSRAKRREQIALPESVPSADREEITNVAGPTDLRINTFESEIDPLEFSLLDDRRLPGRRDQLLSGPGSQQLPGQRRRNAGRPPLQQAPVRATGKPRTHLQHQSPATRPRRDRSWLGHSGAGHGVRRRLHHPVPAGIKPDQSRTATTGFCVRGKS